jgi:hypothetical protein
VGLGLGVEVGAGVALGVEGGVGEGVETGVADGGCSCVGDPEDVPGWNPPPGSPGPSDGEGAPTTPGRREKARVRRTMGAVTESAAR